MEAAFFQKKPRRRRSQSRSRKPSGNRSNSEDDDDISAVHESTHTRELLNLVETKNWEKLLYRVLKKPPTAHVKISSRSSKGNLILHEVCKHDPPIDVVEALIELNDQALKTKGNLGYLPLHVACAHSASIELIQLLHSHYPDAAKITDDDESVLPLHIACITGNTEEEIFMCLLTSYPEGSMIRDDFGRLPIDYAKSIRSDIHRKIAVDSLKHATWFESAAKQSRERTESEYHRRIRGYEQSQAQQLKMIEEVHTKEIAKLDASYESKKKELSERSQDLDELDQHLQEMTDQFRDRMESLEMSMKTKNRKLQGQLEKAEQETTKTQVALDMKIEEAADLSQKLKETKNANDSLREKLEQRTEELDLALEEIETLSKHLEWLDSIVGSIRKLSNSESPVLHHLQRKERNHSTKSKYKSTATARSGSVSSVRDSASVSTRTSKKMSRSASLTRAPSRKSYDENRDASSSFVSRIIGSSRE